MTTKWTTDDRRMSGFARGVKAADSLRIQHDPLGQNYPQHYPRLEDSINALGEPLSIREVARLIGCSAWTVRQRHLQHGLPHFRSGPAAKLIFYHNQVIAWILQQQQKGGTSK
jgi:hypothetical protein